jgi:hypothetical protein
VAHQHRCRRCRVPLRAVIVVPQLPGAVSLRLAPESHGVGVSDLSARSMQLCCLCTKHAELTSVHLAASQTGLRGDDREDALRGLVAGRYNEDAYDLLFNNGNHFSNDLSVLLTGSPLPVCTVASQEP